MRRVRETFLVAAKYLSWKIKISFSKYFPSRLRKKIYQFEVREREGSFESISDARSEGFPQLASEKEEFGFH